MDSEMAIQSILIVRNYPNVFLKELPSMSPKREIEFSIDLLPSTLPISKAPYRMGRAKLKNVN